MGKMRQRLEAKKSCITCAYAKESFEEKYVYNVFCRFTRTVRRFRQGCDSYKPMTCYNCIFKINISLKHSKLVGDDGCKTHYKVLYIWYLNCEKEGEIKDLSLQGGRNNVVVPSCSLWKYGRHKHESP